MYSLIGCEICGFETIFNAMKTCLQLLLRGNLTIFILMDFHKHIDTIRMDQSILCFKGS